MEPAVLAFFSRKPGGKILIRSPATAAGAATYAYATDVKRIHRRTQTLTFCAKNVYGYVAGTEGVKGISNLVYKGKLWAKKFN